MAFGKTEEQKLVERQQQQQQAAIKAQAAEEAARLKAHQNWLKTPVGQAASVWDQGQGFFEIQLQVGSSHRDSTIWGNNNTTMGRGKSQTHAGTLAGIEAQGWRLQSTGYVFITTSESSRDKFLASGQQVAVSGHTLGIYLFRRVERPAQIGEVALEQAYPQFPDPAQQLGATLANGLPQWQPPHAPPPGI